jgi:AcrR family transcriptional regulator
MAAMASGERRDRSDALRNRERLLEAARAVFADQGADASLKSVAARAGLGVGTVYRHFATQDALIEAVLADYFTALQARAEELRGSPEPGQALATWLREFVICLTEYRGLARITMPQLQDSKSALYRSCHQMRGAAAALLADAQHSGTIRADVDINTLLNLANAIALAVEQRPRQSTLALSVLIDGLRPD